MSEPNNPPDPQNKNPLYWKYRLTPIDASNNIVDRRFSSLQHSKDPKTNNIDLPITNSTERDIGNSDSYFNMKLKSVLDKIQQERTVNERRANTDQHMVFRDILDRRHDISSNLAIVSRTTGADKRSIDQILSEIARQYGILRTDADLYFSPLRPDRAPLLPDRAIMPFRPLDISGSPAVPKVKVCIDREIHGLDDLLKLIDDYPLKADVEYNINMTTLHRIKSPLGDLKDMIGMNDLKKSVVDQIIYFIQNLHIHEDTQKGDFMHTVIYGPPGTGKTEVAKIMGKIFCGIGILRNNIFRKATRSDLIAGYLGQTALKTKKMIETCLGGVLFIDEAYALGNEEKRDSFSKECIDTLCEALSDHKENIMVIIAGYKDELAECFFSYNKGLHSRFPWRFHTDDYTAAELKLIFEKKIRESGWTTKNPLPISWFDPKMSHFTFYGRDMETLLSKTKIAHSRRVFCKPQKAKRIISIGDMDNGFAMFLKNNETRDGGHGCSKDIMESLYL